MLAPYPLADERLADPKAETDMDAVKAAIHAGRSLRSSYGILPSVRSCYCSCSALSFLDFRSQSRPRCRYLSISVSLDTYRSFSISDMSKNLDIGINLDINLDIFLCFYKKNSNNMSCDVNSTKLGSILITLHGA